MTSRHHLALDILPTSHPTVLRVSDASIYTTLLHVDCPRLDILLPCSLVPVVLTTDLPKGFVRTIHSESLELHGPSEAPRGLPDGIYRIGYSVSPHQKTRVEYVHLRTTLLTNSLQDALCGLNKAVGEPSAEQLKRIEALRTIELYLQAAVAQVQHCFETDKGLELYEYARLLLNRYLSSHCPTCSRC